VSDQIAFQGTAGRTPVSSRISPFGLAAAFLASSAVAVASMSSTRSITFALALAGVVIGVIGLIAASRRASTAIGGLLCAAVLAVAWWSPAVLNPLWTSAAPSPSDPNELVVTLRTKARGPGRPLQPNEWVDGAKEGLRQDDLFIQLQSVKADRLPDKGSTEFLLVNLRLDQLRDGRSMRFERFVKGKHDPKLTDDTGREYAFLGDRVRKSPSKLDRLFLVDQYLIFELPGKVQHLNLELPASAWGRAGVCRFRIDEIEREAAPVLAELIAKTKVMLKSPAATPPDRALGRALFQKNCFECHTFFGVGGKTGPDLTASKKRDDLDFVLTSIINPSAVIEKKYQPTLVVTTSGQVHNGIIQAQDNKSITILVPSKIIVVPRDDIEEMRESSVSLMPTDLLREFSEHDIRSLISYLTGKTQSPMLATPENVTHFFVPAPDMTNWHAVGPRWAIDKGILTSPEPAGGAAPRLVSDLLFGDDFQMSLRFQPGPQGQCALLIGDAGPPELANAIQIELAAGRHVSIRVAGQKAPVESAETVKPDAWNKLEVTAAGNRVVVRLNDKEAASAAFAFPQRRVLALEGSTKSGQEVLFRNMDLRLLKPEK